MDAKRLALLQEWLKQHESLPAAQRESFLATCRKRDPVTTQLMLELLASPPKKGTPP